MLAKIRSAMIIVIIMLVILTILAAIVKGVGAQEMPPKPVNISMEWYSDGIRARLDWLQLSDANYVCISEQSRWFILLDCFDSAPGPHSVTLPPGPPSDGAYFPAPGKLYVITEYKYTANNVYTYGNSVPYRLHDPRKAYLPLVTAP